MNILFRVDSSLYIGSGHVIRCLTLAKALREKGAECSFICRNHPGNLSQLIRSFGFTVNLLEVVETQQNHLPEIDKASEYARWLGASWKDDAEQTCALARQKSTDWIIVDHYGIDHHWEKVVSPSCKKLMVIDDLANRSHDCHLLLDQNLVENYKLRYQKIVNHNCFCLTGPKFALLQPEYAIAHERTPPRLAPISRVLIYFGAADQRNLTGMAISAFLKLNRNDVNLDVVVNDQSPFYTTIRELVQNKPTIKLHENVPSLCDLMINADFAIGASGATSWERCCLGLPTFVVTLAANQEPIAAQLHRDGYVKLLGQLNEITVDLLKAAFSDVLSGNCDLEKWSSHCRTLVDGKGTDRVVSVMTLDKATPIRVRPASVDDVHTINEFANSSQLNKAGSKPTAVEGESHKRQFYAQLRHTQNYQTFIAETSAGIPLAQLTFKLEKNVWKVRQNINPIANENSLGNLILREALHEFRRSRKGCIVFDEAILQDGYSPEPPTFAIRSSISNKNEKKTISITICSDSKSWINKTVADLIIAWLAEGHSCAWVNDAQDLPGGDICFYLGFERIVKRDLRSRYKHNLVVHASDLPKGRGWSPASWLICEGKKHIPITLLEAVDEVDAGGIFAQNWIELKGTELVDDWRAHLANHTLLLAKNFVAEFPESLKSLRPQMGQPSYYSKRRPQDSELNPDKTIREQFNLLRVVDNESYPAFLTIDGKVFILKIYARQQVEK